MTVGRIVVGAGEVPQAEEKENNNNNSDIIRISPSYRLTFQILLL
jgi:hypothetical protein